MSGVVLDSSLGKPARGVQVIVQKGELESGNITFRDLSSGCVDYGRLFTETSLSFIKYCSAVQQIVMAAVPIFSSQDVLWQLEFTRLSSKLKNISTPQTELASTLLLRYVGLSTLLDDLH